MTSGEQLPISPRSLAQRLTPDQRRRLRTLLRRARWGNLRTLRPKSPRFGFDRGTPIDRHYTELFLAEQVDAVRGVVGEIADDTYARRFGGPQVARAEIIDNDARNDRATMIADLGEQGSLPAACFDCLIVTQTLQYLVDPLTALRNCAAALRAGGTLLVAAPALTPHDAIEPDAGDYWRFWPAGLKHLLAEALPQGRVQVRAYGNLVAAIAFLHGLSAEELRPEELGHLDVRYPVVVLARVDLP